ncbi:MAG TPA: TIGR03618 family F420-dependent PPOX class oxidoreductase [Thermomicrobiales bacterium]|nr:TIGR03618 family F420-dependent PPOX class oxidoreductase [Thermomicrobiales bacterium]
MLSDAVRDFLNERRFAVLATSNPNGTVQQSVMWYLLEGDTIVMNTAKGRVKFRNIDRSNRISLCVEEGLRYVTLTGEVSFNDDQEVAQADIQRIGRRYDTEEEVREEHEQNWKHQQRVTLTMPIDHVVTHGF